MTLSDYAASAPPSILLLGPPGTGKTILCAQLFPKSFIIEADNNLRGPVNFMKAHNLPLTAQAGVPHIDKDGKVVPRQGRFKAYAAMGNAALADPNIDTVVNDSLTTISDYVMDEVRVQQGRKIADGVTSFKDDAMQIQDWGCFSTIMKHIIISQKASGKRSVWIGHIDTREDEGIEGSKVLKKYVNCPGQLREQISGYFDEVWILGIEERVVAGKLQYVRVIRTVPENFRDAGLGLKTSTNLGYKFDVDYAKMKGALA